MVSNVSPKHYGVAGRSTNVNDPAFLGQPKVMCEFRGELVVNTMFWHIHKGDDLVRERPVELDFFTSLPAHPSDEELQLTFVLLESGAEQAPLFPQGDLKPNCTLKCDLSSVPKEFFEAKTRVDAAGGIVKWCEITYKVILTISSGPMKFSLKCNGKEYNSVSANY